VHFQHVLLNAFPAARLFHANRLTLIV
jgi:hypothetical protein